MECSFTPFFTVPRESLHDFEKIFRAPETRGFGGASRPMPLRFGVRRRGAGCDAGLRPARPPGILPGEGLRINWHDASWARWPQASITSRRRCLQSGPVSAIFSGRRNPSGAVRISEARMKTAVGRGVAKCFSVSLPVIRVMAALQAALLIHGHFFLFFLAWD
jgi:hypothetical protein